MNMIRWLVLLSLLAGAALAEDVVDPALVGTWTASAVSPQGTWTFTWRLNADGSYQTDIAGPNAVQPDRGAFRAAGGKWSTVNGDGKADGGTYVFADKDTFTLIGATGALTWKRAVQGPPVAPPAPSSSPALAPPVGLEDSAASRIDPAVIGTWMQEFNYHGTQYTAYMRIDVDGYRGWAVGPKGEDGGGDTGSITTAAGRMKVVKVNTGELDVAYTPEGDTLVLVPDTGARRVWRRAPADVRPPGEASSGNGLSEADKNDPEKCFQEGARLYEAKEMRAAAPWFLRAAERGLPKAELQVGWHYERGMGVAQSWKQAAAWYRRAADHGNATAMKNYGQLCEYGLGAPEDWVQAAAWYQKGADLGEGSAEAALARAYQFGVGVPQDRAKSIEWDKRALTHGRKECEEWVRWLSDPTNNIGFRTQAEHDLVIGGQLRTSSKLWGADPEGILFHNLNERMQWLLKLRKEVDKDEEEERRRMAAWSRQYHETKVRELESQGYSHDEAERTAPR